MGGFIPDWLADELGRAFDLRFPDEVPNTFLRVPAPRQGYIDARADDVPVITTAPPPAGPSRCAADMHAEVVVPPGGPTFRAVRP